MERDWSVGTDVSEYVNEAPEGTVVINRVGHKWRRRATNWCWGPRWRTPKLGGALGHGPYLVVDSPPGWVKPDPGVEADGFVTIAKDPTPWVSRRLGDPPPDEHVDPVNHPSHYKHGSNGAEVIDLTEHLDFCRGSAVKYLCRAGRKDPARELEDLRKAAWYVHRSIEKLERDQS